MLRLALLACLTALPANAVTMTFDTVTTGESYTEAGMTIARIRNSDIPVYVNGWGQWGLDIVTLFEDPTPTGAFHLSTGRPFDLLSIFVAHLDRSDPVTFRGFRNGDEVAYAKLRQPTLFPGLDHEVPYSYAFDGFRALDYLTVTSGPNRFSDMRFDDLTFAPVPLPAALPLLAAALGVLAVRGRPSRGPSSIRPRSPAAPKGASC